jgi:hypothetical protein
MGSQSYADRVKETSISTGTGNFTLAGAITGYQAFSAAFPLNQFFYYCIESVDANGVPTGAWEVGVGYLSGSTTLVRSSVEYSSNANALVNFAAGTSYVFCTLSSEETAVRGAVLAVASRQVFF